MHGCSQIIEFMGTQFVEFSGYNEIAELNKIIVLYPEIERSEIWPSNHNSCWDTWGYNDWHIPGFRKTRFFSKENP